MEKVYVQYKPVVKSESIKEKENRESLKDILRTISGDVKQERRIKIVLKRLKRKIVLSKYNLITDFIELEKLDYSGMKNFYLINPEGKCTVYLPFGFAMDMKLSEDYKNKYLIALEDLITEENYFGKEVEYSTYNDEEIITGKFNLLYCYGQLMLFEDEGDYLVVDYVDLDKDRLKPSNNLDSKYKDHNYVFKKLQKQINDQGLPYNIK